MEKLRHRDEYAQAHKLLSVNAKMWTQMWDPMLILWDTELHLPHWQGYLWAMGSVETMEGLSKAYIDFWTAWVYRNPKHCLSS